ncbi:MAG: PilT/PilU family type 4a pilus ATPase [Patescibacteria group bacterium]
MNFKKELIDLVTILLNEGGSDLHLGEGRQPIIRRNGNLMPISSNSVVTKEYIYGILDEILNVENKKRFIDLKQTDFAYSHNHKERFRGNVYFQQGLIGIALRHIPEKIKTIQELNLPPILESFTEKKQGFFLVVGPAGQGKSTTLASMIEIINQKRSEYIITIEDPIEYIFKEKKSIIDQREVRADTVDFHSGLKNVFRQDANVVMLGEMRDNETISTAVTAAETGHLIFSTLHTNSASRTIERIVDAFPSGQQSQIRVQLASSLSGIFSQRLVPKISGGQIPACELLINTGAVANIIRENRIHEIDTMIQTGSSLGMVDLNTSLVELVRNGSITAETAYRYANNIKTLERLI